MEAIALKAAYLLGNEVYAAGSIFIDVFYTEHIHRMSMDNKLSFLETRLQDDDEKIETIQQAIQISKMAKKVKHKNPEQIAFGKRLEKHIDRCIADELEEIEDIMLQLGFGTVRDLMKDELIKYYLINIDTESEGTEMTVTASNLLQRLLPGIKENEEPEIFFLGNEFLSDDYEKPEIYKAANEEANDINHIYLDTCFTFPDLNSLTAAELQTIKEELQKSGAQFRAKTDEWIDMCYFDDNVSERTAFFKDELLKAAAEFQKNISANNLLKHCSQVQNKATNVEICIGEIPVWQLWSYYK